MKVFNIGTVAAAIITTDAGVFRVWQSGLIEVKGELVAGGTNWTRFDHTCWDYDVPAALKTAACEAFKEL